MTVGTGAAVHSPLLADEVVVVGGVGPGLGRSICLQAAAAGASVVLAARTEERLRAVADEIAAAGGTATVVPTDITSDADVDRLLANTLARTDFDHITSSLDLTILGGLRMTKAFTDALAETAGSIVMINSMVVRHSEPRYGSYKLAKAALLAMSESLATELGDKGIRVNSVLPGYIWDDQLKWYFGEVAKKYGISPDDVYTETAAKSDLKRLPEPDEIARAVVFLASEWASAITGQTLDVNCGQFHN